MKKAFIVLLLLLFVPKYHAQDIIWKSENNLPTPFELRLLIESLNSEINKYFKKNSSDQTMVEIIRTTQLSDEEILIISTKRKLRIYLPISSYNNIPYYNQIKISAALITNRICPEYNQFYEQIPLWISTGFLHFSKQRNDQKIMWIPYYRFLHAISSFACNPNFTEFLFTASIENQLHLQIIAEIGSALLNYLKRKNLQDILSQKIVQVLSTSEKNNNDGFSSKKLIPSELIAEDINAIISSSAINYFYPDSVANSSNKAKKLFATAIQKVQEINQNSALSQNEKDQEISIVIRNTLSYLYFIQSSSPHTIRIKIQEIALRLEQACKKNSFSNITELLSSTNELDNSFEESFALAKYLASVEKKHIPPANRYSSILEYLNKNQFYFQTFNISYK